MSDVQIDQEIMAEFYATHAYPPGAGANWRAVPVLDDDDDDDALDLDTVIEEFMGRIIAAASTCVESERVARGEVRRIE